MILREGCHVKQQAATAGCKRQQPADVNAGSRRRRGCSMCGFRNAPQSAVAASLGIAAVPCRLIKRSLITVDKSSTSAVAKCVPAGTTRVAVIQLGSSAAAGRAGSAVASPTGARMPRAAALVGLATSARKTVSAGIAAVTRSMHAVSARVHACISTVGAIDEWTQVIAAIGAARVANL